MKHRPSRRTVLRAGLALGAAWALPSARACEFFASTLRVTHPWTRASVDGASSAVVCMRIDQVSADDRLIGVETPVARSAEIVGLAGLPPGAGVSLHIPKNAELELGESGVQLRLVGLTEPLLIARTYPMSLHFERGGLLEAELNVDYQPKA